MLKWSWSKRSHQVLRPIYKPGHLGDCRMWYANADLDWYVFSTSLDSRCWEWLLPNVWWVALQLPQSASICSQARQKQNAKARTFFLSQGLSPKWLHMKFTEKILKSWCVPRCCRCVCYVHTRSSLLSKNPLAQLQIRSFNTTSHWRQSIWPSWPNCDTVIPRERHQL